MAITAMTPVRPGATVTVTVTETIASTVTAAYGSLDVGACTIVDANTFTFAQPVDGLALGRYHDFQPVIDGSNVTSEKILVEPESGFAEVILTNDFAFLDPQSFLVEAGITGLGIRDQIVHTALDPAGNPITIDPSTGLLYTTYSGQLDVQYYILDFSDSYARGATGTATINAISSSVTNINSGGAITDGQGAVDFNWSGLSNPTYVQWVHTNGTESAQYPVLLSGTTGSGSAPVPNIAGAADDYQAPDFGSVRLRVGNASESIISTQTIAYQMASGYSNEMETGAIGVTTTTMTGSTATEGNLSFGRAGGAYPDGTQVYWPTAGTNRSIDDDGNVNNLVSFVLFAKPPGGSTWERIEWNQNSNPELNAPANIIVDSGQEFTITWQVTAGDYDSVALSPNDLTVVDNELGQITATGSLTAAQTYTLTVTNSVTGATDSDSVSVNINGSLPLPSIVSAASFSATEEAAFTFDFTVDDIDLGAGDTLTAVLPTAAGVSVANITGNTYRVSGTAASFESAQSDTLTITATNSEGSDTATVIANYVDIPEPAGPATFTATSGQSFDLVYTLNGPHDSVSFSNGGFSVGAVSNGQVTVSGALDYTNGASQTLTLTVVRNSVNYTFNTVVTVNQAASTDVAFPLAGMEPVRNGPNFTPNPDAIRPSETFTLNLYHPSSGALHATTQVTTDTAGNLSDLILSQVNFTNLQSGVNYYGMLKDSSGYATIVRLTGVAA